MSDQLRSRLFAELDSIRLIDPHSHIDPKSAASKTMADILGYHYYTELAHSAGMPREAIEQPGLDPKEKVRRLVARMEPLRNTIQYSWLVEMCQTLFGVEAGDVTPQNWEAVYDAAAQKMAQPDWSRQVLQRSRIEAVFLTNEFDDPLEGFDTSVYIPCLRTDDLVFHLAKREVRERLERATGIAPSDAGKLRRAIAALYALLGDMDRPGGNVLFPKVKVNDVGGKEFLSQELAAARIGREKKPLGPPAKPGNCTAYDMYTAILESRPYPIKALLNFGSNTVMSTADARRGRWVCSIRAAQSCRAAHPYQRD